MTHLTKVADISDEKAQHCIPFILEQYNSFLKHKPSGTSIPVFFVGINGIQGVGKTTLVRNLVSDLNARGLNTVALSIDDFYLTHEEQFRLRSNSGNPLFAVRGNPGTHDMELMEEVFRSLSNRQPVDLPKYDKSAYNGDGDRVPDDQWRTVNREAKSTVDVVIFEGWCVGFHPLNDDEFQSRVEEVMQALATTGFQKASEDAPRLVNSALKTYTAIFQMLDILIHIDAENLRWVYEWRWQAEAKMREETGKGMSLPETKSFVDAYWPAYVMYTDGLRKGGLWHRPDGSGVSQMRLVVGRDRKVLHVERL
ncbi:P-loop containing nucleoside triphosphate hydrolase protein [Trichodelitschia bisporula]|uniref:P-loop containing nucleoside triphosphate hydrolase protein n=1 Tax=Trichodelitschia bisporula TaxID=703511 RepID=A0A6G1HIN0_9PEZI|nr:P-loop containing nucleoside triphosphate hydrolase protein [Trichodelitschia bisporula]